jgi:hypothetical protein
VTFRFISLSPTLKASFARRGEGEREWEGERERKVFSHYKNFQKQHREKKYCMRKKN